MFRLRVYELYAYFTFSRGNQMYSKYARMNFQKKTSNLILLGDLFFFCRNSHFSQIRTYSSSFLPPLKTTLLDRNLT